MKRTNALLIFAIAASAMSVACVATANKIKDSGSIAGKIDYPEKTIPAMQVCAHNIQTQASSCVKTSAGQGQYIIKGLPAAEYYIFANMAQGELKVGGHMLQVQCIRAPCPALLKAVSVASKQALGNINLNEFYSSRDDFPVLAKPNKL